MHVPLSEVQTVAAERIVLGDGNFVSGPLPVVDRPDIDIEVAVRLGRHVGELGAVGRKDGVGVDELIACQCVDSLGVDVHDFKLNGCAAVIRGVGDPLAIR